MVEVSLLLEAPGLQAFAKPQGLVGAGSGVAASGNGGRGAGDVAQVRLSAEEQLAGYHLAEPSQLSGLRKGSLGFQWADIIRWAFWNR